MCRQWKMCDFRAFVDDTLREFFGKPQPHHHIDLMVGSALAESGLKTRVQVGGPARGLWQMEPSTAWDIFKHYLAYRYPRMAKLVEMWLKFRVSQNLVWDIYGSLTLPCLSFHLETNDTFALLMARCHYLRVKEAIPKHVYAQAAYWKQYYNTPQGKGTVTHYLEAVAISSKRY